MPAQRKRECLHSLSVRLRQPEQSRLAQTVEQLVEPCNDVVRTGCVCYRCRCFRTCTGRACRANCACFSGGTGRAGWANCACFTGGAGRSGWANCACFTCGAGRTGRAGWANCACFTCGAGRAGRSREARRSRRTRNASRPHWPHRSPFSSRSARTRRTRRTGRSGRSGRSHRVRSAVAHHRIAHALLPAFARAFPVAAAVLSIVHVVLPFLPICRKSPAVQSMPKAALR